MKSICEILRVWGKAVALLRYQFYHPPAGVFIFLGVRVSPCPFADGQSLQLSTALAVCSDARSQVDGKKVG
jgi:hypothetical protein